MNWIAFSLAALGAFTLGVIATLILVSRAVHVGRLVFLDDIAHGRVMHRCAELKIGPSMFTRACVNQQLDIADDMGPKTVEEQSAQVGGVA